MKPVDELISHGGELRQPHEFLKRWLDEQHPDNNQLGNEIAEAYNFY